MNQAIADAQAQLIEDMGRFSSDPYGYVLYAFPRGEGELKGFSGPDTWQTEILTAVRDGLMTLNQAIQVAIASGHGIGKSALVSWIILWSLSTFPDTKGVVTANTATQLATKTWAELAKWHRLSINSEWFTYTATAIYSSDSAHEKTWRFDAVAWSDANTEAFAGLHNQGKRIVLIFDEASGISDKIWEVAEGALTDKDTEILWFAFGNPTRNTGRFKDCFGKFKHRWINRNIDSRTVKHTNKAQIQNWVDDYGEDSDFVKVRVRGLFPSKSLKQFISEADVDRGYGKHLRPDQYSFAPKILTVDPAWEGDDELVIALRQGLAFQILKTIQKNDNDVIVAGIIAQLEDEHQADAVFIDGGYGTGIVSCGRTMHRNWMIVWFSGESGDPGCLNKRAEMWKQARDWLKEGGVIPADPVLREDLLGPETVPRLDGKIQIESKQDMKKRGLASPNRADALCLSFAHPVQKKNRNLLPGHGGRQEFTKRGYHPLG